MEIRITGTPKEIAALALRLQERQGEGLATFYRRLIDDLLDPHIVPLRPKPSGDTPPSTS